MAKKEKKALKPTKPTVDRTSRWTVRGVPAQLQKAAGDAARARGMTLGQWLTELLDEATQGSTAAAVSGWASEIEDRLARLEASVLEPEAAEAPPPSEHEAHRSVGGART